MPPSGDREQASDDPDRCECKAGGGLERRPMARGRQNKQTRRDWQGQEREDLALQKGGGKRI